MTSRYLAFISLSIGFLIIWTAFLSGVLVSRTYKEDTITQHAASLFLAYEDLGKMTFVIGHELVSMVDWLLVTNRSTNTSSSESLRITWQTTNHELESIQAKAASREDPWPLGGLLDSLTKGLEEARLSSRQPLDAVQAYHDLLSLVMQQGSMRHEQQAPVFAYNLFLEGMAQRFVELALATVYINAADLPPLNRSEVVGLHGASERLMEAAFSFNPRTRLKWVELQEQESPQLHFVQEAIIRSILSGESSLSRRDNLMGTYYLTDVRKHLTFLLLSKEILNANLHGYVERTAHHSRNALAFHISLAVVAVTAILLCLIVMAVSCSYLGGAGKSSPRDSIYSNSDKSHILPQDFHTKPQCYL